MKPNNYVTSANVTTIGCKQDNKVEVEIEVKERGSVQFCVKIDEEAPIFSNWFKTSPTNDQLSIQWKGALFQIDCSNMEDKRFQMNNTKKELTVFTPYFFQSLLILSSKG